MLSMWWLCFQANSLSRSAQASLNKLSLVMCIPRGMALCSAGDAACWWSLAVLWAVVVPSLDQCSLFQGPGANLHGDACILPSGRSVAWAFCLPVCCVWCSGFYVQTQRCSTNRVLDVMPRFTFPLATNLPPAGFCPCENGTLTGHLQCCALSKKCSLNSLWKQILSTSVLEALGVLPQRLMRVLSTFM